PPPSRRWRAASPDEGALAGLAPAVAAAPATAATSAWCPLPRLAHCERTPAERLPVQRLDRGPCLFVGRHLDEGEAARPTGLPIGHDLDLLHLAAVLREERPELLFFDLIREVADVQSLSHSNSRTSGDYRSRTPAPPPSRAAS